MSLKISRYSILACLLFLAIIIPGGFSYAQSSDQRYPTSITSNEVSGKINARDIGDSRLTTYFYKFQGNQGDIFLSVETKNLNGDIDIFTEGDLRPVTKISLFADSSNSKTSRIIYLRKSETLILRIEGRTPNDDEATYNIKFEGSFEALAANEGDGPKAPEVKSIEDTDVKVNSVGTIVSVRPKATPTPKAEIAKAVRPGRRGARARQPKAKPAEKPEEKAAEPKAEEVKTEEIKSEETKGEIQPADDKGEAKEPAETPAEENAIPSTQKPSFKPSKPAKAPRKRPLAKEANTESAGAAEKPAKPAAKKTKAPAKPKPDPLAGLENINLLVEFKDGTKFESPMNEVLKVSVDKGILTIITKDGKIRRYVVSDVAKMTMQ